MKWHTSGLNVATSTKADGIIPCGNDPVSCEWELSEKGHRITIIRFSVEWNLAILAFQVGSVHGTYRKLATRTRSYRSNVREITTAKMELTFDALVELEIIRKVFKDAGSITFGSVIRLNSI